MVWTAAMVSGLLRSFLSEKEMFIEKIQQISLKRKKLAVRGKASDRGTELICVEL